MLKRSTASIATTLVAEVLGLVGESGGHRRSSKPDPSSERLPLPYPMPITQPTCQDNDPTLSRQVDSNHAVACHFAWKPPSVTFRPGVITTASVNQETGGTAGQSPFRGVVDNEGVARCETERSDRGVRLFGEVCEQSRLMSSDPSNSSSRLGVASPILLPRSHAGRVRSSGHVGKFEEIITDPITKPAFGFRVNE